MREYFTVMLKENDTSNLKLLNEKLNEGFHVDERITVGRSTVVTLQKRRETNDLVLRETTDASDPVFYSSSRILTQSGY